MVQFATGSFVKTTDADEPQSYTGVGFQPKALWIWGNGCLDGNEESFFGTVDWQTGFSDGTNQRCFSAFTNDFTSPTDCATRTSTSNIWKIGAPIRTGTLDSFDSDGFTISWTNNSGANTRFHYIAIGGSDVTDVHVGQFTAPSTTGDLAVTGVGFEPELVVLMSANNTTDDSSDADRCSFSIGYMNSAGEQAVSRITVEDNVATSDTSRQQLTTSCVIMGDIADQSVNTHVARFNTMDSDGFTVEFTTASVANKRVFYMALGGTFRSKIGSFLVPQSGESDSQSITSVGFEPRGIIFQAYGTIVSSSVSADAKLSFGAADGINQGLIWQAAGDNDANIATAQIQESDNVLRLGVEASSAASSTTTSLANFVSLDADGFTLDWSVHTAIVSHQAIYVAFGDGDVVEVTDDIHEQNISMVMRDGIFTDMSKQKYQTTVL